MQFQKGYIYHIFNQGNNQRKIFFNKENYIFFLRKIKTHITPYADILAWCLMPNHFHLMVYVKETEMDAAIWGATPSRTPNNQQKTISLNHSIGIILSSYTKAINKQKNTSGSLFRKRTKAECINCPNGISSAWFNENGITRINTANPEKQYPQICFNYIHQNPVKAKLVTKVEDWEFSSAQDYAGLRNGKLVKKELAKKYINTH
ncbi:MAG: hypothetical protein K8R54_18560 [Bacteroidales bacterium]|nr:hypothetical protein [Bacteroidales bacterium]